MAQRMNDFDLLPWAVGLITTAGLAAWARLQARLNLHEKTMTELAVTAATLVEKMDNLSDKLEKHMEHEEKEEREMKTALKELNSTVSDIRVSIAAMPKRTTD